MNIMIIDDEPAQLTSLRLALKSRGFGVTEASDARLALKKLTTEANRIDIILSDYMMPEMDGLELLIKVKEMNLKLPVILMTAHGEKELLIQALRYHCDSYIEKPFSIDELINEIERVKQSSIQNHSDFNISNLVPELVHQINNPLFSILGNAELGIDDSNDVESIKQRFSEIIEACRKIQNLNQEIMNFSRGFSENNENIDLKQVVSECVFSFKALIKIKGITVEQKMETQNCQVKASRFGLEQIFKNLLLNAIQAMDDASQKTLTVTVANDQSKNTVNVTIHDTGTGIKKEFLNKIFNKYFTTKAHGTGLGLKVVKKIVEHHGGQIDVLTEMERGTRFIVGLPMAA